MTANTSNLYERWRTAQREAIEAVEQWHNHMPNGDEAGGARGCLYSELLRKRERAEVLFAILMDDLQRRAHVAGQRGRASLHTAPQSFRLG